MKAIGILLVLMAVAACTWLVADGDRERLDRWTAQWTLGTLNHVDNLLQRRAELQMRIDRMDAEALDLRHYIATLEDNLAYQMEAGRREERYWKQWTEGAASEIGDLRTQLAHAAENEDALMRDLAVALNREPGVLVVHIPVLAHRHAERKHRHQVRCLDNIANELNAVEVRR